MNESHHLAKSEAIAAASDHMRSQVLPLLETAHESSTVLMVLRIDAACRIGRVSIFAQTAYPVGKDSAVSKMPNKASPK